MPAKAYLIGYEKWDPASAVALRGTILRVAGKANDITELSEALRTLHEEVMHGVAMVMGMRVEVERATFEGPQKPEE